MEITITKELLDKFEKFWTDPYFVEYLTVNAPDYIIATLVLQACEDLTQKFSNQLIKQKED